MAGIRRGIAAVVAAAAAACGTLTSSPDDTSTDAGDVDAGVLDAPAEGAAPPPDAAEEPDAVADECKGGSGYLANGGFEDGCGSGWMTDGTATVTALPSAHCGKQSCRVCPSVDGGTAFVIRQVVSTSVTNGDRFSGSVWLRADPGAAAGDTVNVRVNVFDPTDEQTGNYVQPANPLSDTWQRVTATTTVSMFPDGGVAVSLSATGFSRCFVIDDASLARQ